MTIVIDASVTMAWCFEDEATAETDRVLEAVADQGCIVPTLWRAEVANILLVAERRGRVTAAQRDRFLSLLARLPIVVEVADPDSGALVWLGERHGLSAYGAWYLWLAVRSGATLITRDQRLVAAAEAAGVSTAL